MVKSRKPALFRKIPNASPPGPAPMTPIENVLVVILFGGA
jgi:hypothetical protein